MSTPSRDDARALDTQDPLARFVDAFLRSPSAAVFADGNSLGPPPLRAAPRAAALIQEWSRELTAGWDRWLDYPLEAGDRLGAACLGAARGQVVVCDSTTVNLVKAIGALTTSLPTTRLVVAEDEFPTDRYLLQGDAARRGVPLLTVKNAAAVVDACEAEPSIAVLSAVHYRTGELQDIAAVTKRMYAAGSEVIWDLSHAVGAVPLQLDEWGVRLAVGCTYKYLNSGPGAPAFVYVAERAQLVLRQPMWGWFGQRDQFVMGDRYEPADGIRSWLAGTPNILGTALVDVGVGLIAEAGICAIRAKSEQLVALAEQLAEAWLVPQGWVVVTPRQPLARGGHLALARADAQEVCAELTARNLVVPDFRAPDVLRLGFSPLPTRFVDVYDALTRVRDL